MVRSISLSLGINRNNKNMQRQVLISYAKDDPEWTPDQVEAVALAIQQVGIHVSLDLWHQRDTKRHLSLGEWRDWIATSINSATHILCLVSTRYVKLWQSKRTVPSWYIVGFESVLLIHHVNMLKGSDEGRIVTLRPAGRGDDCIPRDLRFDFTTYDWAAERHMLLSHLSGAPFASSAGLSDGLILDGLHYPDGAAAGDPTVSAQGSDASATADRTTPSVGDGADIGKSTVVPEARGISLLGFTAPAIEIDQEKTVADQPERAISPSFVASSIWASTDEWRAPVGDFPPPWASAWGDDVYGLWADLTVNGVTQRMRWIEPSGPEGFWMGSTQQERDVIKDQSVREWANSHEHEPMRVEIKQGFWLADTPCTQAFWQAVTGKNPSHFSMGRDAPERPVESVSWNDVDEQFVRRFAQTPAWGAHGRLCLPSEEQWEYAARAGTRSAYWWGNKWSETNGNADVTGEGYLEDFVGTTPVHRYAPNPWGLHDVHGNVWEWCSNPWHPRQDFQRAWSHEDLLVVRGGSWSDLPVGASAAFRRMWLRGYAAKSLGFRFALRSPAGPEAR